MLYIVILFVYLAVDRQFTSSQDITWTWLGGSEMANVGQTNSDPGGRSGAAFWNQDNHKAAWVFGGENHAENSQPQYLNDLWRFDLDASSWILVHNGTAESQDMVPSPRQLAAGCGLQNGYFMIFGGLRPDEQVLGDTWIYYMPENQWYRLEDFQTKVGVKNTSFGLSPEPRGDMAVWCTNDEMVIFGGFAENSGLHHDLWRFSLSTLSWTESKQSSKLPTDHDFVKQLRYPAGRSGATTWVSGDKLFMFGGNILQNNARSKHLMIGNVGDLWEYNNQDDKWVYYGGSESVCTKAAEYGTLGQASPFIFPVCRRRASGWVDGHQNLWMFGGDGIDNSQSSVSVFQHSKLLSDLWFYNLETYMWTWKGGQQSGDQGGQFGDKNKGSNDNLPGSRCESVAFSSWNYFYLYGGVGHDAHRKDGYLNDVWKLDVSLDSSVKKNSPYAGPVFGVIIFGLSLVLLVSILFLFSRKYFQGKQSTSRGKYKRVPLDPEQ